MDLVSIIIPVYNAERFLRACLDSVTGQTYENIEIIIVDDGSTDSSFEIVREYAQNDSRLICITQNNCGASETRKRGIELAKADYIMFLDADDYLETECVAELKRIVDEKQVDIACCGSVDLNESIIERTLKYDDRYVKDIDDIMNDYYKLLRYTCTLWGKLYRKSLFVDVEFPDIKYGEDTLLNHLIFRKTSSIYLTSYVGYNYRLLSSSTSNITSQYIKCKDLVTRDKCIYGMCVKEESKCIERSKEKYVESISAYISAAVQNEKIALEDKKNMNKYIELAMDISNLSIKDRVKISVYYFFPELFIKICRLVRL